ncbi:MAG: hypothetical protein AMXMBFR36_08230 [Acidobacteriota bacterium]
MSGSDARWRDLRALLGELFELDAAARETRLSAVEPALADEARALLDADAAHGGTASERFERVVVEGAAEAFSLLDESSDPAPEAAIEERSLAGLELGPWRLTTPLGRGGMAEVWEARRVDGAYEQAVAVKLLKRGMDSDEILARFRRERQILARLEHPAIARILDGGVAPDGRSYLVLEKVDGEPITAWCARANAALEERLRMLIAACEAVAAAHRQLVVHRDLKPSNILVTGDGCVKLLDFGIAKLLDADLAPDLATRAEVRILTPAYAAPEQIRGEPVSTATDVYALGVLAYQLVTGRLPHRRPTGGRSGLKVSELESALASESVTRPSQALTETDGPQAEAIGRRRLARVVRGDLDTVLLTALQADPTRRYATVDAFAEDLRRFLSGHPVAARPDTLGYRLRRFAGRHRVAVAASALALAALLAALGAAVLQARRAEDQAERASRQAERAERIRGFLVSVFEVSAPETARGEPVAARSLLDEGARRVDVELSAEPELRAEMLDLLAGLYRKLGELEPARRLAERSLALRIEIFGAESAASARSEWTLGWVLANQGAVAPARARLEHAIAVLDRIEGPDSLAAADAREPLVELTFADVGARATRPIVERRLATYRRLVGERDVRTAIALGDLGAVLYELGETAEAERAFRASAAVLDTVLPPDDPRAAFAHGNLAMFLFERGTYEEAEVEARRAVAIRRAALGDRHPATATALGYLTRILIARNLLPEAETLAREALSIVDGKDRFVSAQCRVVLSLVRLRQRASTDALAEVERGLEDFAGVAPDDHVLVLSARVLRAEALGATGRRSEALSELEATSARLETLGAQGAPILDRARQVRALLEAR